MTETPNKSCACRCCGVFLSEGLCGVFCHKGVISFHFLYTLTSNFKSSSTLHCGAMIHLLVFLLVCRSALPCLLVRRVPQSRAQVRANARADVESPKNNQRPHDVSIGLLLCAIVLPHLFFSSTGVAGDGATQLYGTASVELHGEDSLVIADHNSHTVQVCSLSSTGSPCTTVASGLRFSTAATVDSDGNYVVADRSITGSCSARGPTWGFARWLLGPASQAAD